jgi:hypothetical protein|tara:strand:- start:24 stop:197 length:174 start_codon:yes stop_codon:yes gene_type:complete
MGQTKAQKIESTFKKAQKELDQMRSERRRSPPIMWESLLDGQLFEDVKFKPPIDYRF